MKSHLIFVLEATTLGLLCNNPAKIRELPSGECKPLPNDLARAANGNSALVGKRLKKYLELEWGVKNQPFWVVWEGRCIKFPA